MNTTDYIQGRDDEKKDIIKIVERVLNSEIKEERIVIKGNIDRLWDLVNELKFVKKELVKEINNPKNKSKWVRKKK
ncbi:hypothetical protein LCGC14_0538080 [marine sediment metagenome]|uniref:Uncharacterized protein n=1 Tax=marine sediment metagenome TaxID=412755 RepID=A0A0F9RTP3_9ZZZZ|nr:hypothetical protein [bacterium]